MSTNILGLRADAAKFSSLPYTISQHSNIVSVLSPDSDQALKMQVNRYLQDINIRAGSDVLYIMNARGLTIAASNWDSPQSFVGQDYSNRPYFIDALNGKAGLFYGIGQTTNIPGLFIAVPVYDGGVALGVVAIKVSLRDMEAAWTNLPTPIMLSDARGIFFLSSIPEWNFNTRRPLSQEDMVWLQKHKQYGTRQSFPAIPWTIESRRKDAGYVIQTVVDGKKRQYLAFDELLPEYGWTMTIAGDYEPVFLARVQALVLGALVASILFFFTLYWRLREKRLVEQSNARHELEVRVFERTRELREAHAFQKAMENSLLVGLRACDVAGRIIYVNPAFCDMTGYSQNKLLGRLPPYPYWNPNDMARHWSDNQASLSGMAASTGFESRIRHRNGQDVFTMVYTAPLVDAQGTHTGWMSSVVDITDQKAAQTKQRLQDTQLQHAGRLASLGEMASTMAHELNQPLMALTNYASAANNFAVQGNRALLVNSLQEIKLQAERAADILRRIRGFVKTQTTGVQLWQINTLVSNVLALLQPEIKLQNTRVVVRLTKPLPCVSGDRVLLEQVILNLIMNSLQAMHTTPQEQRCIEIETTLDQGFVCVSVADSGCGISSPVENQLFTPFFTTKSEGLGLGLNICRSIVENHQGQLSFKNRPGTGAAFVVKLPAVF